MRKNQQFEIYLQCEYSITMSRFIRSEGEEKNKFRERMAMLRDVIREYTDIYKLKANYAYDEVNMWPIISFDKK